MKYFIPLFLLIGISLSTSTLFAQFQICNSSTTKDLLDVYFIDANVGIAVGDSGTIIRSTDGGLNWTTIMTNDSVELRDLGFFDGVNGIASGSHLYKTTDAGLTWNQIPSLNNGNHYDLAILDSTTCIITGNQHLAIKSTDKGATFTSLGLQNPNPSFGLLSFVDENIGYACKWIGGFSTQTEKTTDGGLTWTVVVDTNSTPNTTVMEAMSFVSENTGFKGGWYNPHLQKTSDGGHTWSFVTLTDSMQDTQILDFHIKTDQPGAYYASGWYGEIAKSTDGGDTWFPLNTGLSNSTSLFGIYFLDEMTGWAVGRYGSIIKTTSGGVIVGAEEATTSPKLNITISPNPSIGMVNLDIPVELKILSMRLTDASSQQVRSFNSDQTQVDLSGLADGLYFLEIETDQGNTVKKVIKRIP